MTESILFAEQGGKIMEVWLPAANGTCSKCNQQLLGLHTHEIAGTKEINRFLIAKGAINSSSSKPDERFTRWGRISACH